MNDYLKTFFFLQCTCMYNVVTVPDGIIGKLTTCTVCATHVHDNMPVFCPLVN